MNGIAWCWYNGSVTWAHHCQAHVTEPFLGSKRRDDLFIGIQPHAVLAVVSRRHVASQIEQAAICRIAMVARVARSLTEFVDDSLVRSIIRVSHSQIDDIGARPAFLIHQFVDLGKEVSREPAYPLRHINLEWLVPAFAKGFVNFIAHTNIRRNWFPYCTNRKAAGADRRLCVRHHHIVYFLTGAPAFWL